MLGGEERLKHIMREETGVTLKWYEIGLELLDSNNVVVLDVIKEKYPNDANKCCTEMFKKWLEYKPDGDWDQLAMALNKLELNSAAKSIKSEFTGKNTWIC